MSKTKIKIPRASDKLETILPLIGRFDPCSDAVRFLEAHATCSIAEVFFAKPAYGCYDRNSEIDEVAGVDCDESRLDGWIEWAASSIRCEIPNEHPSYEALTDLRWNGYERNDGSAAKRARYLRDFLRALVEATA